MPMFPDSGVPAGDAKNTIDVNTNNCSELWYSTSRCQPRFDPAAANAMLSEDMNLIMKGEVVYDCKSLDHIERAVRYINQRGLPRGTVLTGGPFDYAFALDPVMTRYNDYMTLTVIPAVTNQAAVRVNGNGLGLVQLLRNDGQQLQSADIRANVPFIMAYWAGNWYHVGLCSSQVPIVAVGAVDIWIRTDGNDSTGDGSANTPDKAFATIAGAWYKVGSRFAATPLFTMNFKLGLPGTYVGAMLGPFGGNVTLSGAGGGSKTDYRLSSIDVGNNISCNLYFRGMASVQIKMLTLVRDVPPPRIGNILRVESSDVGFADVEFESTVANSGTSFIYVTQGSCGGDAGSYNFQGRNLAIGQIVATEQGGTYNACRSILRATHIFNDFPCNNALLSTAVSTLTFSFTTIISNNCTGSRYHARTNSIIDMQGQTPPGDVAGSVASGGQYIA